MKILKVLPRENTSEDILVTNIKNETYDISKTVKDEILDEVKRMNEKVRYEVKTAVENLGVESKKMKEDILSVRNRLDN